MRKLRIPAPILSVIAILALVIAISSWGFELGGWGRGNDSSPASNNIQSVPGGVPQDFERLFEVWEALKRDHFDRETLDAAQLTEGAIRGMLEALDDPYAAYLNPQRYRMESEDFKGSFSGIGAEVTMRNGRITIIAPLPDTPADEAGIRAGDIIVEINGESTEGLTLQEAVNKIRGPSGESVDLVIFRSTVGEPINVTLVRGVIEVSSVRFRMFTGRIAHLRITSFTETTNREVRKALEKMEDLNARGLIIDLRNNPGGILDSVVKVTSQFLDEGLVLYEVDGRGNRRNWEVVSGGLGKDIPLVVLINEGSASGAEVLAGALMDHNRGPVIGAKTFGKGSVNTLRQLKDGGGIYFTIARWFTPDGTLIEGEGLEPEIAVEHPDDDLDDVQLDRAVEILEAKVRALE